MLWKAGNPSASTDGPRQAKCSPPLSWSRALGKRGLARHVGPAAATSASEHEADGEFRPIADMLASILQVRDHVRVQRPVNTSSTIPGENGEQQMLGGR